MRSSLRVALVLVASAQEAEKLFNAAHELIKAGNKVDAIQKLKEAARAGHGTAADHLGHIYHVGEHGVAVDKEAAIEYYKTAAEIEHAHQSHSLLWLGNMLAEKKDIKGAQASWITCSGKMKHFVDRVESGDNSAGKDIRNTQACVRKLVEIFTCGNQTKACEEFGPDATQDLRKAFEYFIMMAGTMKEPTLKNIAGKSLRSGQWYPPGWKEESVAVTINETAAAEFEAEHAAIIERRTAAKEAKMKMKPDRERAKHHAMKMKKAGKFPGEKGFKGKKGKKGKKGFEGKKGKMEPEVTKEL